MRSPLWIGLLSVAGTALAACPALAQDAKPTEDQPAKPAEATPAVTIQVDPAAKKALEEAADAVKGLGPCTFRIEMRMQGMKDFKFEATMDVKLIRGKASGSHAYQMMGEFYVPGGNGDPKVKATLFEGKTGEWIDDATKTLFIRPVKANPGAADDASKNVLNKCMTPNKAFEVLFLETNPFKDELDGKKSSLTMEKAEKVGDEECQVVKATIGTNPSNSSYRYIYISALDKLPRKYVQVMGKAGGPQQVRSFEVKNLNTESKLALDDLHLKLPADYKLDKVDPAPPPPPAPPAPPKAKPEPGKDKVDPAKEKERQKEKEAEKEKQKLTPEEKEKQKKEELERTRQKVPPDPNVIPQTNKPGSN